MMALTPLVITLFNLKKVVIRRQDLNIVAEEAIFEWGYYMILRMIKLPEEIEELGRIMG